MKFAGQPLKNAFVSPFSLRRGDGEPLTLLLQPLSLGFHSRLRARGIVPPSPPLKVARDSNGKPLRDAQGMAVTLEDARNAEFLAKVDHYHQTVALLTVVEALQADPHLDFETPPPARDTTGDAWQAYADALFQEMEQAGFTAGDLLLLCREICRLSNLLEQHLTVSQSSFSPVPETRSG